MQAMVSAEYTDHIHFAVVDRRGCIFDLMGPVASAAKTFTLPLPTMEGRMAMVKNTIPKAPIHWVWVRQNKMAWGIHSTSSMMVAPVVVKPDMVSKNASVTLSIYPPIRNGIIPNTLKTVQVSVTKR